MNHKSFGGKLANNLSYLSKTKKVYEAPQPPLTEELARKDMVGSFKRLKLDAYSDILRIKKPHILAV